MKKLASLLVLLLVFAMAVAALDFTQVDKDYVQDKGDKAVYNTLKTMLGQATTNQEKAEVLWRLARVCVDLGDELDDDDKDAKFAIYEEGEAYAVQSIELYPNANAYLWKCCNIGRWGQTKGALNSLGKVKPMQADLRVVTDEFKVLDSSETWYTLAVLYDSVPALFGGDTDVAISYARIATETIPDEVFFGGTYEELAEMLYDRNWTAKKRASKIEGFQTKWNKETKSNYDKYQYYEGSKGVDAVPIWATKKLGEMSDREEALAILQYAVKMYQSKTYHTESDKDNYEDILEEIEEWSKKK